MLHFTFQVKIIETSNIPQSNWYLLHYIIENFLSPTARVAPFHTDPQPHNKAFWTITRRTYTRSAGWCNLNKLSGLQNMQTLWEHTGLFTKRQSSLSSSVKQLHEVKCISFWQVFAKEISDSEHYRICCLHFFPRHVSNLSRRVSLHNQCFGQQAADRWQGSCSHHKLNFCQRNLA